MVTDFILSVEIVIIALGTVAKEDLSIQIPVVTIIALIATVGVYGIVALIVRMDDAGYKLIKTSSENSFKAKLGSVLVAALPKLVKTLTIVGTLALLLVSGGIFVHNIDAFHHLFPSIPSIITEFFMGLVVGLICLMLVKLFVWGKNKIFKAGAES